MRLKLKLELVENSVDWTDGAIQTSTSIDAIIRNYRRDVITTEEMVQEIADLNYSLCFGLQHLRTELMSLRDSLKESESE